MVLNTCLYRYILVNRYVFNKLSRYGFNIYMVHVVLISLNFIYTVLIIYQYHYMIEPTQIGRTLRRGLNFWTLPQTQLGWTKLCVIHLPTYPGGKYDEMKRDLSFFCFFGGKEKWREKLLFSLILFLAKLDRNHVTIFPFSSIFFLPLTFVSPLGYTLLIFLSNLKAISLLVDNM